MILHLCVAMESCVPTVWLQSLLRRTFNAVCWRAVAVSFTGMSVGRQEVEMLGCHPLSSTSLELDETRLIFQRIVWYDASLCFGVSWRLIYFSVFHFLLNPGNLDNLFGPCSFLDFSNSLFLGISVTRFGRSSGGPSLGGGNEHWREPPARDT